MAWISVHQQLRDHRKLRDFFRILDISRQEAIGILVLIWMWALDNADRTGMILFATIDDIAEAAYWKGNSKRLYSALVDSHWIDEYDGRMYFHDWDEFNKPFFDYIDRKEKDKQRKRCGNSTEIPTEIPQRFHGNSTEIPSEIPQKFHGDSIGNSTDIPEEFHNSHSPTHSPTPSPNKDIKDYSLEIENFRHRYVDFLPVIDSYFDVLRTTRVSGKISDSIIVKVYQEMDKHPPITVKYACMTVVNKPELHSKKESYLYGIMRNTVADDAEARTRKYETSTGQPKPNLDYVRMKESLNNGSP